MASGSAAARSSTTRRSSRPSSRSVARSTRSSDVSFRRARSLIGMTPQRRLYVSMLVSLDGYIAGPNGELDWFDTPNPQFERYCDEMIDGVSLAIYGRKSYELMVQYWPQAETPPRPAQDLAFARKINALPKLVLSRTLEHATWSQTRIVRDVDAIAAL